MNTKLQQLLNDLDEQQLIPKQRAPKTRELKELAAEYLGSNADEKSIRAKANKIKRSASKVARHKLI